MVRFTLEGLQQGIRYFEEALRIDPGYALAQTGIAMAMTELGEGGHLPPEAAFTAASTAARAAVSLNPELADAHCAMGYVHTVWEFDWARAEQSFRRALDLKPGLADAWDLYSRFCSAVGRFDEAVMTARRAQELDPLAHPTDTSNALLRADRYQEAKESAQAAVDAHPHNSRGLATLGWAQLALGQTAEGLASLARAADLTPGNPQWLAQYGQALAISGRPVEARAILKRLDAMAGAGFVSPYHRAYIHTGLGEHDQAIDYLEQALASRTGAIYGVKGSFLLAALRPHPRFQALLAKLRLA